jgi:hypothetical protein
MNNFVTEDASVSSFAKYSDNFYAPCTYVNVSSFSSGSFQAQNLPYVTCGAQAYGTTKVFLDPM